MTRRTPKTTPKNLDQQKVADRKEKATKRTETKKAARVLGKREDGA